MRFAALDDHTYLLRLETGEELVATLEDYCSARGLRNAAVTAIGALTDPTLAYFNAAAKRYEEHAQSGAFELTSLLGTIAVIDDEPRLHAHVTLADAKLGVIGGHLVQGRTGGTVELLLRVYPTDYTKERDETTGLKLWELPDHDDGEPAQSE
jgi:uncharacterized protein